MHVIERQMAEDETKVVAERADELSDHRFGLPAIRALEIAVLHERDLTVGGTTHVVNLRIDRLDQVQQWRRNTGSASEGKPPRQVVDRPEDDPSETRREHRRGENAELGVFEIVTVEGNVGDEERHGEADPRHRRRTDERWPRQGQR